jgi:hypothetical protein
LVLTRSRSGTSISELLVSIVLMAFAFMTVGELVVTTTLASTRLTNCIDGVNGANLFLRRLGEDVRTAQAFGSIYSSPSNANYFPDPSNASDISYSLAPHWGGWPTTGQGNTSWPSQPYALGSNCLILQQPAFYSNSSSILNGAPLMIPAGTLGTGVPAVNVQYVDTVVYYVLLDPQSPGQYLIQRARFSGYPGASQLPALGPTQLRTTIDQPQTVLRGVVGPLYSSGSVPAVFEYLGIDPNPSKGSIQTLGVVLSGSPTLSSPKGAQVPALGGLSVNLEIETPVPNTGTSKLHHFGSHSQFFLRANSHIRMTNSAAPGTGY